MDDYNSYIVVVIDDVKGTVYRDSQWHCTNPHQQAATFIALVIQQVEHPLISVSTKFFKS